MLTRSQSRRVKLTTAVVDLGEGDTLNIVFDRNAVTPAWIAETDRQAKDEKDVFALAGALAAVIDSWDLFEDDGVTPVSPTKEEIGALSFGAVSSLIETLIAASSPSRAEGNASSEPSNMPLSASTEPPVTHQNGEGTSPLPKPSESLSPT